mgnify:CR=1 FL=1
MGHRSDQPSFFPNAKKKKKKTIKIKFKKKLNKGFKNKNEEILKKYMSKQFCSLTSDYILSKYFDYCLTKKIKFLFFLSLAH